MGIEPALKNVSATLEQKRCHHRGFQLMLARSAGLIFKTLPPRHQLLDLLPALASAPAVPGGKSS